MKKVKQIPLSDTTISRRSVMLADDLKEQLVQKLRLASSFGIQLDETTDIRRESTVDCLLSVSRLRRENHC